MELNPSPCFNKNVLDLADFTVLNMEMLQINTSFFFFFKSVMPDLFVAHLIAVAFHYTLFSSSPPSSHNL